MTDQRATHPCDGCGTYTADRVCPSCWGTTDDPMWCRLCNGVCQEGPGCSPMREDRMATEGQNTPVSTPSGPSAGLEGQDATQETPDATEAAQRRRERYAEAMYSIWSGGGSWAGLGDTFKDHWRDMARSVITVADQEQAEKDATIAELRAEVERQAVLLRAINDCHRDPARAILQADKLAGAAIIRAHVAEARVAELEATEAKAKAEALREAADASLSCDEDWNGTCCDTCRERGLWLRNRAAILDAPKDTTAP